MCNKLDEYSYIRTHWIALYALITVTYFDSFRVEHIPKEAKKIINGYDSVICVYF